VDGFNLAYALTHETFIDAVELLVPELQKRGVYKTEYAPGTLREKLFGEGPRLPEIHPGSGYRDLAALRQQEKSRVCLAPEHATRQKDSVVLEIALILQPSGPPHACP
jgi:hypothetical protein